MAFLKGLQCDLFYLHEDTFWNKGLRIWQEYFNYKAPYFIPNNLSDNLFLVSLFPYPNPWNTVYYFFFFTNFFNPRLTTWKLILKITGVFPIVHLLIQRRGKLIRQRLSSYLHTTQEERLSWDAAISCLNVGRCIGRGNRGYSHACRVSKEQLDCMCSSFGHFVR